MRYTVSIYFHHKVEPWVFEVKSKIELQELNGYLDDTVKTTVIIENVTKQQIFIFGIKN